MQCSFIFVHFKEYQFTIPKVHGSQRIIPAHDAKLNQHADGWGICSPQISMIGRSRQIELRKVTKASIQVAFSSYATGNAVTCAVAPNLKPRSCKAAFSFFDPAALNPGPANETGPALTGAEPKVDNGGGLPQSHSFNRQPRTRHSRLHPAALSRCGISAGLGSNFDRRPLPAKPPLACRTAWISPA